MNERITIAGGGLAGLSLAIGLRRRGVAVVLHEAGSYPRHRVCGEFISGVGRDTLEALGIEEDLAVATPHRRMSWFRGGRSLLETELPEPALAISRHRLDLLLRDRLVRGGGEVFEKSRQRFGAGEGLVWAAGRPPRKSIWIGLKFHALGLDLEHGLEMHLGSNGYAGLTPVEGGRVNVCGLFHLDRRLGGVGSELMLEYLRKGGNSALADRLAAAARDEDSFLGVSAFELGWQDSEDGRCAIGDAAGMIPPFTGNGMSMAFESAELALEPLAAWSGGRMSWSEAVSAIHRDSRLKFRRRVANAMAMHRLLLHGSGQRLVAAIARAGMLPLRPLLSLVR